MSFNPTKVVTAKERRNIKIEVGPERYAQLQGIAAKRGISLKELVRQAVDYAIDQMVD
jgi:type IV secretory pathway ATPase VirB11/archaellum biosynthesis ATPase